MPDKAAYDELPDGVVVVDADGLVVSINPAGARILGRGADETIGHDYRDVLPLVDAQGNDWWECTDPFAGLLTRIRQPERMLTMPAAPGSPERDLLVTATYVRDADRRVKRLIICLRDTAARRRTERSGAELVSTVAHELRSPLTSVKGFTATLLTKWERFSDEQKKLMLQTVNSDADRVTRLISELLDVSRIEAGRLELRKQVVDLPALVQRDFDARIAAGESPDRFRLVTDGQLPEMWVDPDKLAQVVGNLIENAMRHGGGTVTVTVTPRGDHADPDGAAVSVADEGEGIPAQALGRIFTKFWRGGSRGGTGLGLYIAKGIVDAHGGTIEAGRAPDGGAMLRFELPAGTPSFAL
ncbi:MAG TPA: ATP-binding protein [Mycobacteriales bacterium]|nr:ATP-binding protein [Mycobacteriales bacterium]